MTDITKQGGRSTTATERMESARSNTQAIILRELCLAVTLARLAAKRQAWSAWVGTSQNEDFPLVLVIESPVGVLTYRVHRDESDIVSEIEHRDVPVKPQSVAAKEATLLMLVSTREL